MVTGFIDMVYRDLAMKSFTLWLYTRGLYARVYQQKSLHFTSQFDWAMAPRVTSRGAFLLRTGPVRCAEDGTFSVIMECLSL